MMPARVRRILGIQRDARRAYQAGKIPQTDFFRLCERVRLLCRRVNHMAGRKRRHLDHLQRSLRAIDLLHEAVRQGGRILALDTGFHGTAGVKTLEEVGITEWVSGQIIARNIVTEHGHHRIDNNIPHPRFSGFGPRNTKKFVYGESTSGTVKEISSEVQDLADRADAVVVFSGSNDCFLLGLDYHSPKVLELHHLSWAWFGRNHPTLDDFCARHGVEVRNAHCSGNDSYHTLALALRLVLSRQRLLSGAARAAANQELVRDQQHAVMMRPTRKTLAQRSVR